PVLSAGNTCDDDDSGEIHYLSIRYGGFNLSPNNEINGLTLGAVGRETSLHHIEVFQNKDDGIEFFGGTANMKYFVSDGSKDDSFDYTFGWRGYSQYGFVLQDAVEADRGWEGDNNGDGQDNTPRSDPKVWNITWIGDPGGNDGILIREGSAGSVRNAIVMGFGSDGLDIADDPTVSQATMGNITLESMILWNNGDDARTAGAAQTVADNVADDLEAFLGDNIFAVNPMLRNVRFEGNPDPRLLDGSPAGTPGAAVTPPSNGFLDTAGGGFHGAFGFSRNWLDEWTFFGGEDLYQ
ncbi:MAG: hypothetical protein MI861_25885, partial [Pirellulales bacterium]|nr:hypothetical protein [Pirellulales bacterium]